MTKIQHRVFGFFVSSLTPAAVPRHLSHLLPRRRGAASFHCSAAPSPRSYSVTLIPGDGIGPEVVSVARDVLYLVGSHEDTKRCQMGGTALDAVGVPLPEEILSVAKDSDAVLLGAIGGYKWDSNEKSLKPETGCFSSWLDSSTLKRGGIYFGKPKGFGTKESGEEIGFNTELIEIAGTHPAHLWFLTILGIVSFILRLNMATGRKEPRFKASRGRTHPNPLIFALFGNADGQFRRGKGSLLSGEFGPASASSTSKTSPSFPLLLAAGRFSRSSAKTLKPKREFKGAPFLSPSTPLPRPSRAGADVLCGRFFKNILNARLFVCSQTAD
ncbi:unnamed protein product [Spirodela intermedia]|uniref:Isopropylmalate dehydrogenase-like domain-containing protein n=1 Tax=Spirodela intermedia TaxID=51605 RepID=A0A7I8LAE2_SPIIN|nr:unnamed protein product [Spirodela intermedia]